MGSDLTRREFESLRQGRRLLLSLLLSLTAAAAPQDLHHVPVDPVGPGQGVPVHLNTAHRDGPGSGEGLIDPT